LRGDAGVAQSEFEGGEPLFVLSTPFVKKIFLGTMSLPNSVASRKILRLFYFLA